MVNDLSEPTAPVKPSELNNWQVNRTLIWSVMPDSRGHFAISVLGADIR